LESSVVGRNLASFKLRKDIECGFQITQLAKKREYYFSASSEREKNEWIEDLEKIIDDFRNADVRQSRALAELWKEAEEQVSMILSPVPVLTFITGETARPSSSKSARGRQKKARWNNRTRERKSSKPAQIRTSCHINVTLILVHPLGSPPSVQNLFQEP